MSRSSGIRGWLPRLKSRTKSTRTREQRAALALGCERMEERILLTVQPVVSKGTVTFSGSAGDSLYLETDTSGNLLYHDQTSTTYTSNLGGSTVNLHAQDTTVEVYVGGTLYLEGLTTGGKALTIDGQSVTKPQGNVAIQSTIDTQGGSLAITNFADITVGTSTGGGVTVSTRDTGGNLNYATAPSVGESGDLTMTVVNPNPLIPIVNINSAFPQITVDAGSQLLAQADHGFKEGAIGLKATNLNYTLDGLTFPTLSAAVRSAAVTFQDGSSSVYTLVQGGEVEIQAVSGDMSLNDYLAQQAKSSGSGASSGGSGDVSDSSGSWASWVPSALNAGLQVINMLPGMNLLTLPLSVSYKSAGDTVTVGQYTQIIGEQAVNIESTATADATGQAIYSAGTQFGAAISFMMGVTDAETDLKPYSLVESTGGDVAIKSVAKSTAKGSATVTQNQPGTPQNPDSIQVSLAVGISQDTALSTVEQNAVVKAAGNVEFAADGDSTNKQATGSASYNDGEFGSTITVNATLSNIRTTVAGTMISGSTSAIPTETFNPYTAVDFGNNAIRVPSADFASFRTGQQLVYNSNGGGAIDGLKDGETYYVIVPANLSNEIQLAETLDDALNDEPITFAAYPTLSGTVSGVPLTIPVTSVDESTGTLNFGFNPGFTNGEALTYAPAANRRIGGLSSGTYYAIVNPANPNALQLATTPGGSAVPLNLDTEFQGFQQNLPITIQPTNTIQFSFAPGFQAGDHFVYEGSGINGLTDGVTYWPIATADPTHFQLASSAQNAQNKVALSLSGSPTTFTFNPSVSINPTDNTIDMGFNYALANTLPTGTALVYYGALGTDIANLSDGTTYYVVQDPANPRIMRLASTAALAQAAYQAGLQNLTTQSAADTANAAALGATWTAQAIDSVRQGAPPPVGTFPLTVDSTANTLDFGFNPGFSYKQPVVYNGPASGSEAINGLTPGNTYYVSVSDPVNNPGVIQLLDASGNVVPISLTSGTTTTVEFSTPFQTPIHISNNAITFGDPSNPFDPGYHQGDPFVYEGPVSSPGDVGVTGLVSGTTYYVIPGATTGTYELADSLAHALAGNALPISLGSATSTHINATMPLAPVDNRPTDIISFGSNNPDVMFGTKHILKPVAVEGLTIGSKLGVDDGSEAETGIGEEPKLGDKLSKPAVAAPAINSWASQLFASPADPNAHNSTAKESPASAVEGLPGGSGSSPSVSLAGAIVVQVELNTVKTDITGTAVLESAADLSVNSSLEVNTDTKAASELAKPEAGAEGGGGGGEATGGTSGSLAIMVGVYLPTVTATVEDGAQLDAYGTLTVSAKTEYPLIVPTTTAALQSKFGEDPTKFVGDLLSDSELGAAGLLINNDALSSVKNGAEGSVGIAGNLQVLVYVNDTEAIVGNAKINQKASDPNYLGDGSNLALQNPGQSVAVTAETDYNNIAEGGKFALNLSPEEFVKNYREKGAKGAVGEAFNLYGDDAAGSGYGASIYINALDDTTIAQISSGAKIGVGASGTLNVLANHQVLAISLVQAGVGASGDIGFDGTISWYNLDSTTIAQIQDGVTVNAGYDANNHPLPAGAVSVQATDNTIAVGVTGGAVKSQHLGVGVTVAVNNVSRTTEAVIGSLNTPAQKGNYDVGSLNVNAQNTGFVASVAYAAVSVTQPPPTPPEPQNSSNNNDPLDGTSLPNLFDESKQSEDPLDGVSLPGLFGEAGQTEEQVQGKSGIAVSGDASLNVIQNTTLAYINDHGTFVTNATSPLAFNPDQQQSSNTIHFAAKTGLVTGDPVTYSAGTSGIGGLNNNQTYYAIVVDPYDIQLADTLAHAESRQALTLSASGATGKQTLTTADGSALTFLPSAIQTSVIAFTTPNTLAAGQAVQYKTSGSPIGGLTNGGVYYVIPVDANDFELAGTYADALDGNPIALDFSKGSGTQTFTPLTANVQAAERTIIVSVAGAIGTAQSNTSSATAVAGSFSADAVITKTRAFIDGATLSTNQLNVTANNAGYIGSLTAGASGATAIAGQSSNAVAGSVSVDIILPDTEAYVTGATLNLGADSNITATDHSEIWTIAGSGAFGGSGGYGAAISVNIIGTENNRASTLAYIAGTTITQTGGSMTVSATDANPSDQPRIVAIAGSLGVNTQATGAAGAGMVAVNFIADETDAYVTGSTIQPAAGGTTGNSNLAVTSFDNSWIISIGGAVTVSQKTGIGAGIGYNQIDANTHAYINSSTVAVNGTVTVTATDNAEIAGGTVGVGVSAGSGGIAGAGSASVNEITDTTDAHIASNSDVTAGGAVSVSASDTSMIVSVAGGVAIATQGAAVGAAVSYNLVTNSIKAYIDGSTVDSTGSDVNVRATSSPLLVAIAVGGSGGSGFALGGSITINSIANDLDAHISNGSAITAHGNVSVTASEGATMYVLAGGIAVSTGSAAVGASIAYNYMGGSFDPANPDAVDHNSATTNGITAYIDGSTVEAGGSVTVGAGFAPPSSVADPTSALVVTSFKLPTDTSQLFSNTIAGSGGAGFALGATVSLNFVRNSENAYIANTPANGSVTAGGPITVYSTDASQIDSGAFSIAGAESVAAGAAVATNDISNTVRAEIAGANVSTSLGGVSVTATSSSLIANATVGGAASGQAAVSGSVSVNEIHNTVDAHIANMSTVTAPGSVNVAALDSSVIAVLAGALGASGAAAASVASATNDVGDTLTAYIDASTVQSSGGDVDVTATFAPPTNLPSVFGTSLDAQINALAISGAGAGDAAAAGSIALNWITNSVQAYVDDLAASQSVAANLGTFNVTASDSATIHAAAGTVTGAGAAAVGASVSYNYIGGDPNAPASPTVNKVLAYLKNDAGTIQANTIDVKATDTSTIDNYTVAGAGSGAFAFGGAVALNFIRDDVEANVNNSTNVAGTQGIALLAQENAAINALSGSLAVAGGVGGGLGGAYNDIKNTIQASISDSTATSSGSDVSAQALSTSTIDAKGAGIAASGASALAGSASVNLIEDTINAFINGSHVTAYGNVNLLATSSDSITAWSGTLSAAAGASGGGTVVVNVLKTNTNAYVENSTVNAAANGSAINVSNWDPAADTASTESVNGLAVIAENSVQISVVAATGSAGGAAGLGMNVVVNNVGDGTNAYIDGSTINNTTNPGQTVVVRAIQTTNISSGGGVVAAGAGAAAVGADADIVSNATRASITGSTVTAGGNGVTGGVEVGAWSRETVQSITGGVAAAGLAGVAGGASGVNVSGSTQAYIGASSTVNTTGNLNVVANDESKLTLDDGYIGAAGAVGSGGSVAVALLGNVTTADITNSTTNANGETQVEADSHETVSDVVVAVGAGGALGLGLSAGVVLLHGTTAASINAANVNQNAAFATGSSQSVVVHANDTVNQSNDLGTIGAGVVNGGVGAGVNVVVIENAVDAHVAQSNVQAAQGAVDIAATGNKTVTTDVFSFAGGADFAVDGALALISIGTGLDTQGSGQLSPKMTTDVNTTIALNNGAVGLNTNLSTVQNAQNDTQTTGQTVNNAFSTTKNVSLAGETLDRWPADTTTIENAENTTSPPTDVTAYVGSGSTVYGGAGVNVKATDTVLVHAIVGGVGGSLGTSVGGSVGIVDLGDATQAYVDDGATVSAGSSGAINVQAGYTGGPAKSGSPMVESYAGQGGLASSLGAQAAFVNDSATQQAFVGHTSSGALGDAVVTSGAGLNVSALATRTLSANAKGVSIAGGDSAGVSAASVASTGNTLAFLGQNVQLGQSTGQTLGGLTINATANNTLSSDVFGIAASLATSGAGGTGTETVSGNVEAYVDSGSALSVSGSVSIEASSTSSLSGTTDGGAGGLVGGVGEMSAKATKNAGATKAYLNDLNSLTAGGNLTDEAIETDNVTTSATAGAGGVGAGVAGASADAEASPNVYAGLSSGDSSAQFTVGGTADIKSFALGNTSAKANGVGAGLAAGVGDSDATSKWTPTVESTIGPWTQISTTTGDIDVRAFNNYSDASTPAQQANNEASSTATASGGAAFSVVGANASSTSDATVTAHLQNNDTISAGNALNVTGASSNRLHAEADGTNGGIIGAGSSSATGTLGSTVYARTDDTTTGQTRLAAGHSIAFLATASNVAADNQNQGNYADAGIKVTGGSGGIVGHGAAAATVTITDPITQASLGMNTIVNAPNASLQIVSQNTDDLEAAATETVGGAVANNETDSTSTIKGSQTLANIDSGSQIFVAQLTLSATDGSITQLASSDSSVPFDLAGTNTANSTVSTGVSDLANIYGSNTTITTSGAVTITAQAVNSNTVSHAHTTTTGLTGTLSSNAGNDKTLNVKVHTDSGSQITAGSLLVNALQPTPDNDNYVHDATTDAKTVVQTVTVVIGTVCHVVGEVVSLGGLLFSPDEVCDDITKTIQTVLGGATDTTSPGTETNANTIDFNSNVAIGSTADAALTVDANGNITKDDGISATVNGNEVDVASLTNSGAGSVELNAPGGVTEGSSNLQFTVSFNSVDITNASTKNLVLQNIEGFNVSNPPTITVNDSMSSMTSWQYKLTTNASASGFDIENTNPSGGDIILDGDIVNVGGMTTIQAAGGSILAGTSSALLYTRLLTLDAAGGTIGTSTAPLLVSPIIDPNDPSGLQQASAASGVYLTLSPRGGTTAPVVQLGNISSTTGDIVVSVQDCEGQVQVTTGSGDNTSTTTQVVPVAATVDLQAITASQGSVNLNLGSTTTVATNAVFTGLVSSPSGTTTINATGTIEDSNLTNDVSAATIDLIATGDIGSPADPIQTQVGTLEASSGGSLDVHNSGNLAADGVSAAGAILLIVTKSAAQSGNFAVDSGSTVTTSTGPVTVQAAHNITVTAGSSITTKGTVTLHGGYGEASTATSTIDVSGDVLGSANTVEGDIGTDTVSATGDANFALSQTALNRFNGTSLEDAFVLSSIENATLTGGASANTFTVSQWSGVANLDGAGAGDTFTVDLNGSGSGTTNIADSGTTGTDSVIVNSSASNNAFTLDGTQVALGQEQVNDTAAIESLTVNGQSGADTFTVHDESVPTTLNGQGGSNTFSVLAIHAPLTINGGTGPNAVNVGSITPFNNGLVDNIQSTLTVIGSGSDTLDVDDTGSNAARTGTLTASALTGLNMGAGGIAYSGLSALNVELGSGSDTFNVLSTAAGTTTALDTGGGTNTVNVGGTAPFNDGIVSGVQGSLAIAGHGSDTLNVDDTGDTAAATGAITTTSVTGLGMGSSGVSYSELKALNVGLGTGGNTFNVQATATGMTTTLDTGAGTNANVVNVGSLAPSIGGVAATIQGPLVINSQGQDASGHPLDSLNVDDTGDSAAATGTITTAGLNGLGMGPSGITYGGLKALNVNLGTGGNTFNVPSTAAVTTVTVNTGAGTNANVVNVGSLAPGVGGVVATIQGPLVINGQGQDGTGHPLDTLNVDDTGDTSAATGTLTASWLTGLGMGSGGILYSGVKALNINLGTGGNTFNVQASAVGMTTTVNTGTGTTSSTINVGSQAPGAGGVTAQVQGPLVINGQGRDGLGHVIDTMNVDDTGDAASASGTLTASSLTGLGMAPTGISYHGLSTLTVNLGKGGNTFNVQSTAAGTATTVNTGAGTNANAVNVGSLAPATSGTVAPIQGPLMIDGQGRDGSGQVLDTLNVDDTGDAAGASGTLTATKITGLGLAPSGIAYSGLKALNVSLGTGGDTFNVLATAAATTATINTGAGSVPNVVNVGSLAPGVGGATAPIQGPLVVNGQALDGSGHAIDTLNVDDTGDNTSASGTLTATNLKGLGMGSSGISYRGLNTLNVNLGTGGNTFSVQSTAAGTTAYVNTGAGAVANTINVGSLTARIQGSLVINGQGRDGLGHVIDTLNVNDTEDTVCTSGLLTATTVTGLGMAPSGIAYNGLKALNINLGTGGNTFNVQSTAVVTTSTINAGAGTKANVVNVGSLAPSTGGIAATIQGPLVVNGQGQDASGHVQDTLNVDDTGDATAATALLTANRLTGLGMGSAGIAYNGLKALNINLGMGGNTFNAQSTAAVTTSTVNTGAGTAPNVVNVGSLAPTSGGVVASIQGALVVNGQGRDGAGGVIDRLNVDDTGNTATASGTLAATTITGLGMGSSGITYDGLKTLNVNLGTGGNTFNVQSTAALTTSTVNTGAGMNANVVNVGSLTPNADGTVALVQGSLLINGQGRDGSGHLIDTVNVDDTGDAAIATGLLTSTKVTGLGMAPSGIVYNGLKALNISLGTGGNAFNVQSTAAVTTSTINTGAGSTPNVVNVGSLAPSTGGVAAPVQGPLVIHGQGRDASAHVLDTVNVDDTGDVASATGTLTATHLTGLEMGPSGIAYDGLRALNINLGAGGNVFDVQSTAAVTTSTVNTGAGNLPNVVNVGSLAPTVGGVAAPVQGALVVNGQGRDSLGAALDTLNVDDTGNTSKATGTLTATDITGLGMGSSGIAYDGLKTLNINLGTGGNCFNVQSTAAVTTSTVNAGAGSNANTVNVGSIAPNTGGVVARIQGPLLINGQGRDANGHVLDTVSVDDTGDTRLATGMLTAAKVNGLNMDTTGIAYDGLKALNISLGTGGNQFYVQSTAAVTTSTINTGAGDNTDLVNVGGFSLNLGGVDSPIQGPLVINGQGRDANGHLLDMVNVDDSGDTAGTTATLTANTLMGLGLGPAGMTYNGLKQLSISLGGQNDTFNVMSTPSGTTTTLMTGGGANTVNVGSVNPFNAGTLLPVLGTFDLVGEGTDTLNVDDTGVTMAQSGTLTDNQLTGLSAGPVLYSGVDLLNVKLGSGANTLAVNVAPGQNLPQTTNIDGGPNPANVMPTLNWGTNLNGTLQITDFPTLESVKLGGDIIGTLNTTGAIASLQVGDSVLANATVNTPSIGSMSVGHMLAGAINVTDDLGSLNVGPASMNTTGVAQGLAGAQPSYAPGDDLSGTVQVGGTLTTLSVAGNLSGTVRETGTVHGVYLGGGVASTGKLCVVNTAAPQTAALQTLSETGALAGTLTVAGNVNTLAIGPTQTPAAGDDLSGLVNVGGSLTTLSIAGNLSGTLNGAGTIQTASVLGDLNGLLSVTGVLNFLSVGGSIHANARVSASNLGNVTIGPASTPTAGHDLAGQVLTTGTLTTLKVAGNLSGSVCETGTLQTLCVGGSLTSTGAITTSIVNGSAGSLNSLTIGKDLAGQVKVAGSLEQATIGGGAPGAVVAGTVGSIAVGAAYGPCALIVNEAGIERMVEVTSPVTPLLPSQSPTMMPANLFPAVRFQEYYEGLASTTKPSSPILTVRVSNTSPTTNLFDLSLVTDSNQAKFDLARLDSKNNSASGVVNVSVEGDILSAVTAAASAYFGGPINPSGVYLPADKIQGVGVRDFVPNGSIHAASIQAVAFGRYTSGITTVSAATAQASNAMALLATTTKVVPAGSTSTSRMATLVVPFADVNPVAFFYGSVGTGGAFAPSDVLFSIEDSTAYPTPSADNLARGSDVALVTVYDPTITTQNASLQTIAIHGDNASVSTSQTIAQSLTSTGPLGDVTLQGPFNGLLSAPCLFGSLTFNGGPLRGIVQTTGLATDPLTGATFQVPADLGRVYTTANGALTTTTIHSTGSTMSGTIKSAGNLISQVIADVGLMGVVEAQGNIGVAGSALGGVVVNGPFSGTIVALGNLAGNVAVSGNVTSTAGNGLSGVIAANGAITGNLSFGGTFGGSILTPGVDSGNVMFTGRMLAGRIVALNGLTGNVTASGGLDAASAIISGAGIGNASAGTTVTIGGTNKGFIAAVGAINSAGTIGGTVFKQQTAGSPGAIAIDAIFTKSVGASLSLTDLFDAAPLYTYNMPKPLNLILLKQMIANEKALVVKNGVLSNG